MERHQYIAVTIGPIDDTINLASTPAALWAASYMFSMLSKNICETLTESGVGEKDIISPRYDPDDPLLNRDDGVGMFHDRIIFRADAFDIRRFGEVRETALKKTVGMFGFGEEDLDFFRRYFLIAAFRYESDSPILDSSKPLFSLELMKPLADERGDEEREGKNPLLSLFSSDDDRHKNERIKQLIGGMHLDNWQLYDDNRRIMSLEDIASNRIPHSVRRMFKKYKYYAVVRSDGDRMSEIIQKLDSDEKIAAFSQTCLSYCAAVADAVKTYGGVTVFSGGDDLLALVPVENSRNETVFDFIRVADRIFKEEFSPLVKTYQIAEPGVSLSFGVWISYYKFPLYEALERSADLLFGTAKKYRGCSAVNLQKHAGQSEGLLIFNDSIERFTGLYKEIVSGRESGKSEILLSAMNKLILFERLFNTAQDDEEIQNLFNNIFDAEAHTDNAFLKASLPRFFSTLKPLNDEDGCHIYPIIDKGIETADIDRVLTMDYILRIIKFFTESGGEEE